MQMWLWITTDYLVKSMFTIYLKPLRLSYAERYNQRQLEVFTESQLNESMIRHKHVTGCFHGAYAILPHIAISEFNSRTYRRTQEPPVIELFFGLLQKL